MSVSKDGFPVTRGHTATQCRRGPDGHRLCRKAYLKPCTAAGSWEEAHSFPLWRREWPCSDTPGWTASLQANKRPLRSSQQPPWSTALCHSMSLSLLTHPGHSGSCGFSYDSSPTPPMSLRCSISRAFCHCRVDSKDNHGPVFYTCAPLTLHQNSSK